MDHRGSSGRVVLGPIIRSHLHCFVTLVTLTHRYQENNSADFQAGLGAAYPSVAPEADEPARAHLAQASEAWLRGA